MTGYIIPYYNYNMPIRNMCNIRNIRNIRNSFLE